MILVEKAKRLAEMGERVVFIVAFSDYDKREKKSVTVSKSNHFLYQSLHHIFAEYQKIALEFVNVWKVLDKVNYLMTIDVHIFVDEFSFAGYSELDEKADTYAKSFRIGKVITINVTRVTLITTKYKYIKRHDTGSRA